MTQFYWQGHITWLHHVWQMRRCFSSFPFFAVWPHLGFIGTKNVSQSCAASFRCFLVKSNLALLLLSLTSGLHLAVNSLYFHSQGVCWLQTVAMTLLPLLGVFLIWFAAVFLNNGNNSVIMHFSHLLWSFWPSWCCWAAQCINSF